MKDLIFFVCLFVSVSFSAFAASYTCLGKSGDTTPAEVFPNSIVFDTSIRDDLGGPQIMRGMPIFSHKIGNTIRQTVIFTKNGKAKVTALANGKVRWYQCTKN